MTRLRGGLCLAAVLMPAILQGQTVVTLNGTPYTLRAHPRVILDGPDGPLTASISDRSGGGRANPANPMYNALSRATANPNGGEPFAIALAAALKWKADGDLAALALAKSRVNSAIESMVGAAGCDETKSFCGNANVSDFTRFYFGNAMQTYSIIRSELTAAERQAFADKFLNDNDSNHNGLNPPGQACTPQPLLAGTGTLTSAGTTITVSGGSTSQFQVGDRVTSTNDTVWLGTVLSIVDATHFVIDRNPGWSSAFSFRVVHPWATGNCGVVWLIKHHQTSPRLIPSQASHCAADYPPTGCWDGVLDTPGEGASNTVLTALYAFIATGIALADDDPRAATLLQQAFDHFYQYEYAWHRSTMTGFSSGGPAYGPLRIHQFLVMIAAMMKQSVVNGPDLTSGVWLRRMAPYFYYVQGLNHQDIYSPDWAPHSLWGTMAGMLLYPNTPEAQYANYWVRNVYAANNPGDFYTSGLNYIGYSYAGWFYLFLDPTLPAADLASAPTQYLFRATDYAICRAAGLSLCVADRAYTHAMSLTDLAAPSATKVLLQSSYNNGSDHSGYGNWGAVTIFKNGYLLAGDRPGANNSFGGSTMIALGTGNYQGGGWVDSVHNTEGFANIIRWAGADPSGDPTSNYAYALMDLKGAYDRSANATRVQRHVIHFKKRGAQDYVVWYDDIATSAGGMKKAYLHFYRYSCQTPGSCSPADITWGGGNNGGTVASSQAASRLITAVLPTAGANTALLGRDNADGSYPGAEGYTYRAYICAEKASAPGSCDTSATTAEWLVVHKPTLDGAGAMPELTQITAADFRGVQINDADSPKVALVGMQGALRSAVSFTTSHPGTGQYVVAGLSAGLYEIYRGTTRIERKTVATGDSTLYFESSSGAFRIVQFVNRPRGVTTPKTRVSSGTQRK